MSCCTRPTRDDAYLCDDCTGQLNQHLAEIPWLVDQLNLSLARRKGVDYRTLGTTPGRETPLIYNPKAGDHLRALNATLAHWVKYCTHHSVTHQSPTNTPPDNTPQAMSRWLMWRVDGLAYQPLAPTMLNQLATIATKATHAIDRPADKWYAGPCNNDDAPDCKADLYAKAQDGDVDCPACGATYDVAARRQWLLESAEDRLADAATLARSVTWLGAAPLTADRVRKWAERGRIVAKGHAGRSPLYRIGDAIDLLAKSDQNAS